MDPNAAVNKDCLGQAMVSGIKAALQAGAVSGALYFAAVKYSPFFRNTFNASARTALTVMPIFYTGYLNVEIAMHACMEAHRPTANSMADEDDDPAPWQRAAAAAAAAAQR